MQKIKIIVFDLGCTLMEYKGMHLSWVSYYKDSFDYVNRKLSLGLSEEQIDASIEIYKSYNPRIKPREVEIAPEKIFADITSGWNTDVPLKTVIDTFFESLKLEPIIYEDSIPALKQLRKKGLKIAALTDVATGMPDELHKNYVAPLLPYFDLYVSSLSCGFKKPNPKGLEDIARHFNAKPEEILMVGDDRRDVEVARRFGCKSVLIRREGSASILAEDGTNKDAAFPEYGQNYSVRNLEEFLNLNF